MVVSCVNAVGVEVNTASAQLLSYVSGLGPALAENIVKYRDENGPFPDREELKKVQRLGAKAFEQAAGFLRIRDSAKSAGCQRRPSGKLRHCRENGPGSGLLGCRPDCR